jgi:hypothetical protein
MTGQTEFDERFDDSVPGPGRVDAVVPARVELARRGGRGVLRRKDGLHLTIPDDHPLWCPDLHPTPLRVSPCRPATGRARRQHPGQQPFKAGLVVCEEQPTVLGYTPHHGTSR